jgi:hypothetical protein
LLYEERQELFLLFPESSIITPSFPRGENFLLLQHSALGVPTWHTCLVSSPPPFALPVCATGPWPSLMPPRAAGPWAIADAHHQTMAPSYHYAADGLALNQAGASARWIRCLEALLHRCDILEVRELLHRILDLPRWTSSSTVSNASNGSCCRLAARHEWRMRRLAMAATMVLPPVRRTASAGKTRCYHQQKKPCLHR